MLYKLVLESPCPAKSVPVKSVFKSSVISMRKVSFKHRIFKICIITFQNKPFSLRPISHRASSTKILLQAVTKDQDSILICTWTKFKRQLQEIPKKQRIHIPATTNYMTCVFDYHAKMVFKIHRTEIQTWPFGLYKPHLYETEISFDELSWICSCLFTFKRMSRFFFF